MKKPVVDYRTFRLSKVNEPQFRHLKLLLGWVVYLLFYFLTENFIPESKCHVIHSVMDDVIPFNEYFVIFYVSWYFLIVGSLLYFALYDVESFSNMQKFIILSQFIAMVIYIVYPSIQNLRPTEFERQNFFTWLLSLIYTVDTPTGVFPSLHVGYSMGILSAWLKRKETSKTWKLVLIVWCALICISTSFVKQHSFLDIESALFMSVVIELIVYRKRYFRKTR